jgi:Family of unknown function (DUF5654)
MSDYSQYPDQQGVYAQPSGAQPSSPQRRMLGGIDPRRAIDPAAVERMVQAQVAARAQAQAATTVVLATIVSLITSAFSFVAALAWNTAIQQILTESFNLKEGAKIFGVTISKGGVQAIYAIIVTMIAVVVVVILNRIARRYVGKSALTSS